LERDNTEIVVLLCEAIGEEVPDKFIHKCSKSSK